MIEYKRIYYYFILGAAGSLTGWYLAECSLPPDFTSLKNNVIFGALFGGLVGMAIASYDGIEHRSMLRFMRFGGVGLVIGGLTGALAQATVQWLYNEMRRQNPAIEIPAVQSILIGLPCWLLLGGMIGLGAVINKGTQIHKGVIGGLIGGLFGGLFYEIARVEGSAKSYLIRALSLGLLGGAIGASVAFIATVNKNSWFEVANGRLRGRTYDVTKYVNSRKGNSAAGLIGSDANAAWVYVQGDKEVVPRHAKVHYANGSPMLTVLEDSKKANMPTLINGRPIKTSMPLSDGDFVQVGSTTLIYHQKSKNRTS